MKHDVGVFGLGLIGTALSARLIKNGHSVSGCDPDPSRIALLKEMGGQGGAADEIWQKDIVFSAVFDTDQLADLIAGIPFGGTGLLVSLSTCDPERMTALAQEAMTKGWRLAEAPISGTSDQLAKGAAVFLVGAAPEDYGKLAPILTGLGAAQFHVGALGNGNRAKLAVNLILGLNRAALAEGLVFAEKLGLSAGTFLPLVQNTAAASAVMRTKGVKMVAGDFEPQGRIEQSAKDFDLILRSAAGLGQALPFAETYRSMMQDCVDHGEAGFDNAAIIRAIARAKDTT